MEIGKSPKQFQVGLTADFYDANGKLKYADIGLNLLQECSSLGVRSFSAQLPEITPEQLSGQNAVIVLTPRVTAASLACSDDLIAIVRFGVGYDSVDVDACTNADVALCITAGAVDHSVAEATVGWMLALSHHLRTKDQLVRSGRWDERSLFMGSELRDRTLGLVGFGGIGRAVLRVLSGFRMQSPLVYDPFVPPEDIRAVGATPATLEQLLNNADFVSLHCPLNTQTRNLISARELAMMKPSAFLLNTARGGIVDEDALYDVLIHKKIAGAALDCFEDEPLKAPSRWSTLDNVLLAPHSIAWTNELFRDIGRTACRAVIDFSNRQVPRGLVNPQVLERATFQDKWQRVTEGIRTSMEG
jgi:phosphoglycerate dehydrogenase-like enzyme